MIFNSVMDALKWVMPARGILNGQRSMQRTWRKLDSMHELGIPVASHKCVGQLTCITFLGTEVDTVALELYLPGEKMENLGQLITDWQGRKCCKKRSDLESLTIYTMLAR